MYNGASDTSRAAYPEAARAMGRDLARRGQAHSLTWANGDDDGALADCALQAGGAVIGIILEGAARRNLLMPI